MKRLILASALSLLFSVTAHSSSANELLIWDKLQGTAPKGYVLLLRHSYAPGVGDPENFKVNDCSTQRNLSDVGRQDAKALERSSFGISLYKVYFKFPISLFCFLLIPFFCVYLIIRQIADHERIVRLIGVSFYFILLKIV